MCCKPALNQAVTPNSHKDIGVHTPCFVTLISSMWCVNLSSALCSGASSTPRVHTEYQSLECNLEEAPIIRAAMNHWIGGMEYWNAP